ncbi:MAG: AMP-binding protein [Bacteroidales bacterium]|nr:AMP-binding protein [Bacteroidales bacterium]
MKNRISSDMSNLPQILSLNAERYPDKMALGVVNGISYSYSEMEGLADYIATMLYSIGLQQNDRVAIYSENNPHWGASYFGTLRAGGITVPILPDFTGKEVRSILVHSETKVLFISRKLVPKLDEGLPKSVTHVVLTESLTLIEIPQHRIVVPEGMEPDLRKISPANEQVFMSHSFPEPEPDDLASIIYTSGTTGKSKGVMLTHNNILFDAVHSGSIHQVFPEDVFLSVLPLAHTYECTIGMVVPLLNGASVYYIDRAPTASYLGPVLREIRPTTMLTVPLIIEKIYKSKVRPALYKSAFMKLLMRFGPVRRLLSRAAGKKLTAFFGGRMRFFGIGGAPLAPDVERFLIDSRFPYAIGYGLTETAPLLSGFNPSNAVFRSVGKPMAGVEIKIGHPDPVSGEGEIIARGENIMKGYYLDEDRTREVFTDDGFFRTGDLGYIDNNGVIHIRGRLKNVIIGPNGENIYPEEIEAIINEKEYVNESLVMEYKGKLVARVHLNIEQIEEKLQELKSNAIEFQEMVTRRTEEMLEELKRSVNEHVSKNSQLQLVMLQMQPFEKTPTMKIKRYLYL